MPKISVIVPVYKAEKYIERCAKSLFEQTLDDVEYIFIDDCSPDESVKVLEMILLNYPHRAQHTIISKMPVNSRQAAVRKKAIELASGDFIFNCDSDDWLDLDLFEKMYAKAIEENSDVVVCPFRWEFGDSYWDVPNPPLKDICTEELKLWYKKGIGMNLCNKLVRRSILVDNDILPYEGINMWEDNGVMFRVFYYAQGLSRITDSYYHYDRANESSITYSYGRPVIEQMLNCARYLSKFFKEKPDYEDYKKTILALKFYARIELVATEFSWLKEYYKIFPETDAIISDIPRNAFSKRGYIRFWFVKNHLAWLFVLMFKCYSRIRKR